MQDGDEDGCRHGVTVSGRTRRRSSSSGRHHAPLQCCVTDQRRPVTQSVRHDPQRRSGSGLHVRSGPARSMMLDGYYRAATADVTSLTCQRTIQYMTSDNSSTSCYTIVDLSLFYNIFYLYLSVPITPVSQCF